MRACVEEAYGNNDFRGRVVAIQGCGHVGRYLAQLLAEAGARLVVSDIARDKAKQVATETGATVVEPTEILRTECDILAPCALGAVFNDETIPRLKTRIVAGAANNVLLKEEHGRRLMERGILYAPDYVINAGGIINVSIEVEPKGYDAERSRRKVDNIYLALKRVFEIARRDAIPTNEASNRLAEERLAQGRRARQPV
jgi:leucine dehydrogenase